VYEVVAPLQRAANRVASSLRSALDSLKSWRTLNEENARLREEVQALRMERDRLLEAGRQNEQLRQLLELVEPAGGELLAAEVIARSPSNWLGSITISRGRVHGVAPGMAVVAPEGAVGKVRNVTERTAEVVLITDSRSAVGGRVRDRGHLVLVEGTSDPTEERATVRLLDWEADLRVGDVVVASELSWIFPKGLPIGVVEQVHERESGLAPYGTLRPFVDLARLEWVMVVLAEPIEAPWWEETP
jgi:rod shape-determining protein MreC